MHQRFVRLAVYIFNILLFSSYFSVASFDALTFHTSPFFSIHSLIKESF